MEYLLTIALGPVQEFIAAARRTADLKAGSQLLVDVAREVAKYLESQGAEMIFPANTSMDPPNKILCIVKDNPRTLAEEARKRAQDYLLNEWHKVESSIAPLIDSNLATHQIENFLEFYAAWVPLDSNYADARQQVERLLAGRKALRDFTQPYITHGRPKSPLDPSRDTVVELQDGFCITEQAQRHSHLRLKPRETLDAISLLKRIKGYQLTGKVPSTSEMALRSFWKVAERKVPQAVSGLNQIKQELELAEVSDLFFERWNDIETKKPVTDEQKKQVAKLHRQIIEAIGIPDDQVGYYAILLADGDKMGERISNLKDPNAHKGFSQLIANFAGCVPGIIQKHDGYLVYCGGDDVLALLPANRALTCAKALRDAFQKEVPSATLSAGIALVHHLDNLQYALEWARQAERVAKRTRNAVAVALHPRSGEAVTATTQWDNFAVWQEWIEAFRQGLARGFPYELYALAQEYEAITIDKETLRAEAERVLNRKEGSNEVQAHFPEWAVKTASSLKEFASILVIARFLAVYPEVS